MSWQETELWCVLIVTLMMTSSVFCLEILPKGKLIQSGSLVIGSSGSTSETEDGLLKKTNDEHLGDTNGYQSDQPAMIEGSRLAMLRLRRLSPSVQCHNDSMSLQIKGSQVPNFLVETSEEGLVPLSQLPSSCGYSVRRGRRDLSLSADYDCCNVQQQGNTYVLPLRLSDVTMKVVCPMARPRTTVFCRSWDMIANLPTSLQVLRLKVNGVWQPLSRAAICGFTWESVGDGLTLAAPYWSPCWRFEGAERRLSVQYAGVELTLSCPAFATSLYGPPGAPTDTPMTATIAPAGDLPGPHQWVPTDGYLKAPFMPWYYQQGHPNNPKTTVPAAPASADDLASPWLSGLQYPHFRPRYIKRGPPGIPPVIPQAPVALSSADQQALHPLFPGWQSPSMPWHFPYGQPGAPKFPPQTTPATTVAPSNFDQPYLYSWLPEMKNPYIPVAYSDDSMSRPNGGFPQQGLNAFSKYQHFQRPGVPAVNPSGYASQPAIFPLHVKANTRK